jgi:hypothetical protein
LAWSLYDGTTWSPFLNIVTSATSAPSCTTDNNNAVICAIFTTQGATLANRFVAGAWSGFLNIGGVSGGKPDCVSLNSGGKVACFAKAYNSAIYTSFFNGGSWLASNWGAYTSLKGQVIDNASCTTNLPGRLVCGIVAVTDAAFFANSYNGLTWNGWTKIISSIGLETGMPSCTALAAGKVMCIVKGTNNKLSSVVGP